MPKAKTKELPVSQGVNALIARLRDEGIQSGKTQAEDIVAAAKQEAADIKSKAQKDAQTLLETTKKKSDAYVKAGEDALQASIRDAVLEMKSGLMEHFSEDVQRLIANEMKDPAFLRQMILEIAGRIGKGSGVTKKDKVDVILPQSVTGLPALREDRDELETGELTKYVKGLTGKMMKDGVTFAAGSDSNEGVKIRVKNKDVIIDVSDKAVAALLLQHLQPRFRAILEGVVK